MKQFMRIAMAILRSKYPYFPQRKAMAAKLYTQHLKRKNNVK